MDYLVYKLKIPFVEFENKVFWKREFVNSLSYYSPKKKKTFPLSYNNAIRLGKLEELKEQDIKISSNKFLLKEDSNPVKSILNLAKVADFKEYNKSHNIFKVDSKGDIILDKKDLKDIRTFRLTIEEKGDIGDVLYMEQPDTECVFFAPESIKPILEKMNILEYFEVGVHSDNEDSCEDGGSSDGGVGEEDADADDEKPIYKA